MVENPKEKMSEKFKTLIEKANGQIISNFLLLHRYMEQIIKTKSLPQISKNLKYKRFLNLKKYVKIFDNMPFLKPSKFNLDDKARDLIMEVHPVHSMMIEIDVMHTMNH